MIRKIIFYENHFIDFYSAQNEKLKTKIQYVFELIRQVEMVPEKFLKNLSGHKGLYEIRISYQSESYRIFCCFDEGKLIVLFNGFQKKTQKTPTKEIEKALKIKDRYFEIKRENNGNKK